MSGVSFRAPRDRATGEAAVATVGRAKRSIEPPAPATCCAARARASAPAAAPPGDAPSWLGAAATACARPSRGVPRREGVLLGVPPAPPLRPVCSGRARRDRFQSCSMTPWWVRTCFTLAFSHSFALGLTPESPCTCIVGVRRAPHPRERRPSSMVSRAGEAPDAAPLAFTDAAPLAPADAAPLIPGGTSTPAALAGLLCLVSSQRSTSERSEEEEEPAPGVRWLVTAEGVTAQGAAVHAVGAAASAASSRELDRPLVISLIESLSAPMVELSQRLARARAGGLAGPRRESEMAAATAGGSSSALADDGESSALKLEVRRQTATEHAAREGVNCRSVHRTAAGSAASAVEAVAEEPAVGVSRGEGRTAENLFSPYDGSWGTIACVAASVGSSSPVSTESVVDRRGD